MSDSVKSLDLVLMGLGDADGNDMSDARLWGCSHEPECETPEACGVKAASTAKRAPASDCPTCSAILKLLNEVKS